MGDKLKSATALTFSTSESNERVRRNNERVTIKLERQVALRRPDRLWFKATGDRDLEGVYNGKVVMLITHKDKVFGEFPAPPTLEETADAITSKYGIPLPIADLLTYDPKQSLLDARTTGGWQGREAIEGVECNVLAYQHPNVDFSIWIPASGDPLPKKLAISYKARRGQPKSTILFRDWNLSPQLSDETFARKVPSDYEGIPSSSARRRCWVNLASKSSRGSPKRVERHHSRRPNREELKKWARNIGVRLSRWF